MEGSALSTSRGDQAGIASRERPASQTATPLSTAGFAVAVVLGLAFIGVVQLGVRYAELVTGRYVTGGVPPIPAFGVLLVLVGMRPLLRRVFGVELRRDQLLLVYSMVALGTFVSGAYGIRAFLPHTVALQYWSLSKRALAPFVQYLPAWFAPSDATAIRDYFQGNYGRGGVPWGLWLGPVAIWLTFWVALVGVAWCLMLLFRRQWIQHERLSFPLLTLPLALTSEGETSRFGDRPLFRNPMLWLGLGVPALADGLNILHALYPNIPAPSTGFSFSGLFPDAPLTPLNPIRLAFMWEAIGFGYFVPLEISFSMWFFFAVEKLFAITALASGYEAPGMPFLQEQSAGAYFVVGGLLLYGARRHLAQLGRRAFLQSWRRAGEEEREGRIALLGLVAGAAYLLWFVLQAGLPLRIALPYFAFLACFMLVYARIRAETGVPFEFIYPYSLPKELLIQMLPLLGVNQMGGARAMTIFSAFAWLSRHHSGNGIAAYHIDALKLADVARVQRRRLFIALALAFLFGIVGAFWSHLSAFYEIGSNLAAGGIGQGDTRARVAMQEYDRMAQWVASPPAPDLLRLAFVAGGGSVTLALALLRNVWLGSPFHPLGFILATAYGDSGPFAFPLFVAWFLKWLLLRVGGLPLYRAGLPFFIGLIIGHFSIAGVFWPLFSLIISPEASAAFHLAFG